MITTPEWEHWRQMPHAALWEYVAISCEIEPRKTSHDRLTVRGFNEYIYEHPSSSYERKQCERYQSRIAIAVAHLEAENLRPVSQIVNPPYRTKVTLDGFLLWITGMNWSLHYAMKKMEVASNIAPNKEALITEESEIENGEDAKQLQQKIQNMQEEARGILKKLPYGSPKDKGRRANMVAEAKSLMAKAGAMQNAQQDEKAGEEGKNGTSNGAAVEEIDNLELVDKNQNKASVSTPVKANSDSGNDSNPNIKSPKKNHDAIKKRQEKQETRQEALRDFMNLIYDAYKEIRRLHWAIPKTNGDRDPCALHKLDVMDEFFRRHKSEGIKKIKKDQFSRDLREIGILFVKSGKARNISGLRAVLSEYESRINET